MSGDELVSEVGILKERLISVNDKAVAAHARVDRVELQIRDDLKEIMGELKQLSAHMHLSKGWAAAALFIASLLGGIMAKLLSGLIK